MPTQAFQEGWQTHLPTGRGPESRGEDLLENMAAEQGRGFMCRLGRFLDTFRPETPSLIWARRRNGPVSPGLNPTLRPPSCGRRADLRSKKSADAASSSKQLAGQKGPLPVVPPAHQGYSMTAKARSDEPFLLDPKGLGKNF